MSTVFDGVPRIDLRENDSRLAIFFPRAGVVVTRMIGHFSSQFAQRFEDACEPEMVRGGFVGLHDWTQTASFDLTVPPQMVAWTVARLGRIRRIVIATTHPIVSLAVRSTNLTVKRIEHLDSLERLMPVIDEELRRDSKRPSVAR